MTMQHEAGEKKRGCPDKETAPNIVNNEGGDIMEPLNDSQDINEPLTNNSLSAIAAKYVAKSKAIPSGDNDTPKLFRSNIMEFLQKEIPEREMLLSPVIPAQGVVMLYAERGIGKTHVALGMAYAVATGTDFLRWKADKPRRVLYIDGEMPAIAMQDRIRAIVESVGAETLPDFSYFTIITPDEQPDLASMPDISTKEGQAALDTAIQDIELIVVDNLSTLARSYKENEADSWLLVQEWLLQLRRRGISVLLVHHAGKSGDQRGSSRREDILDTVINLRRPDDYNPVEGARFEVHLKKARGFSGEEARPFEAMLQSGERGQIWTVKDVGNAKHLKIQELTAQNKTCRQIAEAVEMSPGNVNKIQHKLKIANQNG